MSKLLWNLHVYWTGPDGRPATTTPHAHDRVAQANNSATPDAITTATATTTAAPAPTVQQRKLKSERERAIFQNRCFTLTKNIRPAAGTTGTTGTTGINYIAAIDHWAENAPHHLRPEYRKVARDMLKCVQDPAKTNLRISNQHITTLPPMPPHLTRLELAGCRNLTVPPDVSACTRLQEFEMVRCTAVTTPPVLTTCAELRFFKLDGGDSLTRCPDFSSCRRLSILTIRGCSLLVTPPDVSRCDFLRDLNLSGNARLATPPVLAACALLRSLSLNGCAGLRAAPDVTPCAQLRTLYLEGCARITSLPEGWAALRQLSTLSLCNTPLTSLPEDILHFPRACAISFYAGSMPAEIRNRLDYAIRTAGYSGPHIAYTMAMGGSRATPPLELAVQKWRVLAADTHTSMNPVWLGFKNEEGSASFSLFLARLAETSEYQNEDQQPDFIQRVDRLLDELEREGNEELRGKCFAEATVATDTCGDRIALSFLHMETYCALHKIEKDVANGTYDKDPAKLWEKLKEFHRLAQIEEMARNKASTLNFSSAIEINLGYVVALCNEFKLPVKMNTMLYHASAKITRNDLKQARAVLNENKAGEMDPAFIEFLSHCPPATKLLSRLAGASKMQQVEADIDMKVASEKQRIRAELDNVSSGSKVKNKSTKLMHEFKNVEKKVRAQLMAPLFKEYWQAGM